MAKNIPRNEAFALTVCVHLKIKLMSISKSRTGIWFAVAVGVVLALWFGGNELYTRMVILPREYPPLQPGSVSLIGMKVPGYFIVVSNGVARLMIGEASTFSKPEAVDTSSGKTIPMAGLVGTLRGEPEAAAELTLALNDITYDIQPLEDRVWTKSRIDRALAAPGEERSKLEYDLGTSLEGKGIERLNWDRLTTGVWLEVEVPIALPSAQSKQLVAKVRLPYRTRVANAAYTYFQRQLERGGLDANLKPSVATISGVYNQALDDATRLGHEDVAASISSKFSQDALAKLAKPVEDVLTAVEVLVTEKTIESAELKSAPREDGKGDIYTVILNTNDESRDRLWQYTYRRPGAQLLLVSNGVAIAAPVVRHEIKYSTVEISGISEQKLAEEALRFINTAADKKP